MRSAYLFLTLASGEEADRVYELLSDGGQLFMPMQETFARRERRLERSESRLAHPLR